jgi:hypothetical protein
MFITKVYLKGFLRTHMTHDTWHNHSLWWGVVLVVTRKKPLSNSYIA